MEDQLKIKVTTEFGEKIGRTRVEDNGKVIEKKYTIIPSDDGTLPDDEEHDFNQFEKVSVAANFVQRQAKPYEHSSKNVLKWMPSGTGV